MDRYSEILAWGSRTSALMRRRYPQIRQRTPAWFARAYTATRLQATQLRHLYAKPLETVEYTNLFHCSTPKAGSQWIKTILADVAVYRYTGLSPHGHVTPYQKQDLHDEDGSQHPFPPNTIVGPLYISSDTFSRLPKAGPYKAIFVMRDPRDLIVSWYFSARTSHIINRGSRLLELRAQLQELPREEGLRVAIDLWRDDGLFETLRSWHARSDPDTYVVRYEDLTGPSAREAFGRVFTFLEMEMPGEACDRLLHAYSFERLTGRTQGEADVRSHLRSGRGGDWKNHLDSGSLEYLEQQSDGLAAALGYEA